MKNEYTVYTVSICVERSIPIHFRFTFNAPPEVNWLNAHSIRFGSFVVRTRSMCNVCTFKLRCADRPFNRCRPYALLQLYVCVELVPCWKWHSLSYCWSQLPCFLRSVLCIYIAIDKTPPTDMYTVAEIE